MASLLIRNRDTGITLETHEFAPEMRLSLYETYSPGARIVCGTARYHVRSVCWNRVEGTFTVGVSFEAMEPSVAADID